MADTVELMRQRVLNMAIRGQLVEQREEEGTASTLLKEIQLEKEGLTKGNKNNNDTYLPTINDKDQPYEIPKSWGWVRIGDIAKINPRNQIDDEMNVGFIPMTMIEDGYSDKYAYEERKWADIKKGFTHFQQGDIILAKIAPCFENKKSAILNYLPNGYGAGTTELHVIRVYERYVLKEYVYSLFKNDVFIEEGRKTRKGTAGQQRIGKDFISNYLIGLPPLSEQKRIVAKIEEIFAVIDQIGTKKEEALSIIRNMRQAALQDAIMGVLVEQEDANEPASILYEKIQAEKEKLVKEKKIKKEKPFPEIEAEEILFEIPDSWKWTRLGEISILLNGDRGKNYPGKRYWVDEGIPFINAGTLNNRYLSKDNMNFIPEERYELLSNGFVEKNDIIYCLRGSLGKISINKDFDKGAIASSVVIIRSIGDTNVEYLYYLLTSDYGKDLIKKVDSGTAQPNLSAKNVSEYIIPLPPLAEQHRIVEKLDEIMAIFDQMEAIFDGSTEVYEDLKIV